MSDQELREELGLDNRNGHHAYSENSGNLEGGEPDALVLQENPTDDELRDEYLRTNPNLGFGMGAWRTYNEDRGIWEETEPFIVKRGITRVLEEAKSRKVRPTMSRLASVEEFTRIQVAVSKELWDADPNILVCRNGALDLTTGDLLPHSKDYYATAGVPYDYDDAATSAAWERVLRDVVEKNLGWEAVEFIQEFAGYCLTPDTHLDKALWFTGPKGGGRSTILEGLRAMLGPRAGVLSLADISRSTFGLSDIPGKTLLTAMEQPASFLRTGGILNAIISGDPIRVDVKHRRPIEIISRCKVAWAMNELPRVANVDDGIFRRVEIIELPSIPDKEPWIREAVKEDGAAILNWSLAGLVRLRRRGKFQVPDTIRAATAEYEEENDTVGLFVASRCEVGTDVWDNGVHEPQQLFGTDKDRYEQWCLKEGFWEESETLHQAYSAWCEVVGHKPKGITTIAADWKRQGFIKKRRGKGRRWVGVRLKRGGE